MNILIACEFSGIVRDAFRAKGHSVMSCDFLASEQPGPHWQGDVINILYEPWDMLIAHPVCTYLANSGSKHLYKGMSKKNGRNLYRWAKMREGAAFFRLFLNAKHVPKRVIENPIMHGHAKALGIGQQTQTIQPWQHGHEEMKATCLWLRGLEPLVVSNIVGPPPADFEERKKWAVVHRMPPGVNRDKDRSRFYSGIAEAMANQWG